MAGLIRRGNVFYAVYRVGGAERRVSLARNSFQVAKVKVRLMETALDQGEATPFPTKTPIGQIVAAYIEHMKVAKTARSALKDSYYLREMFGPVCPALEVISRARTPRTLRRPPSPDQDRRCRLTTIEATYLEQITTATLSEFMASHVRNRGLAPKTANRYREVLHRLFAWAMKERGIKMPGDKNPVAQVARHKEPAPQIRFLTLEQIDAQLAALKDRPQLQAMVAMYIYAGIRREEALWLQPEDIDLAAGHNGMIRIQAKTVGEDSWQPKTKVNRAIPISRALRTYLEAYTPRPSFGTWYFPSPKGKRYDVDNFSQDLRAANMAAGLPWTCLDYRHTFGSQLAMKGESLYKIATLLGNSPEICRRHYAALVPEAMLSTVEFSGEGTPTLRIQQVSI
jgi:integrase